MLRAIKTSCPSFLNSPLFLSLVGVGLLASTPSFPGAGALSLNTAFASSYAGALDHVFATVDGQPQRIRDLGNSPAQLTGEPGAGWFVVFWAGWCVPCKEELALLQRRASDLGKFRIVAVNIDDSAGWQQAQGTLSAIQWQFPVVRDDGGGFFYSVHASGELPLALWIAPDGTVREVFTKVDESTVTRLASADTSPSAAPEASPLAGFSASGGVYFREQKSNLPGGEPSRAIAGRTGVKYGNPRWEASLSYEILKQRRPGSASWTRWEDEIGKSYLEIRGKGSESEAAPADSQPEGNPETPVSQGWKLRLGDDDVDFGQGQLFLARVMPASNETLSVLGAHALRYDPRWSIEGSVGRVRNGLFGFQLDPSLDISETIPEEYMAGAYANLRIPGSWKVQSGLGYVAYRREKNLALGLGERYQDARLGGHLSLGDAASGLRAGVAQYETQTPDSAPRGFASRLVQVDGHWTYPINRSDQDWTILLPVTYADSREIPPHVLVPVLTDELATPFENQNRRAVRVNPRAVVRHWSLEPSWVWEKGSGTDTTQQSTWGVKALYPESAFKLGVFFQEKEEEATGESEEWTAAWNQTFAKAITGRAQVKRYDHESPQAGAGSTAAEESGQRVGVGLDVDFLAFLGDDSLGSLVVSGTHHRQSGHYLRTSGIDDTRLSSGAISYTRRALKSRFAFGKEPGGIVCAAGTCAQRAPLNGYAFDLTYAHTF